MAEFPGFRRTVNQVSALWGIPVPVNHASLGPSLSCLQGKAYSFPMLLPGGWCLIPFSSKHHGNICISF